MKKLGMVSVVCSSILLGAGTYYLLNNNRKVKKLFNDMMDKANELTNNMTN